MSTWQLWLVIAASLFSLITVIAAEETRVNEAQNDAQKWRKRACPHGGTSFQPYDGDGVERS